MPLSYWAHGWAQRQTVGDPAAKAVLKAMCYCMRDESLLVYVGIPTLVEYTEFDDRTVRKALKRLADDGRLLDTGLKKNNVTVWRIPAYENWLRAQVESPDNKGRASETDLRALAQVAELTKEKTVGGGQNRKPLQKGEGHSQAPSNLQASPPISAPEAPPKMGANLLNDLHRSSESADQRANPSGSLPAQTTEPDVPRGTGPAPTYPEGYEPESRRIHWTGFVIGEAIASCQAKGLVSGYRPTLKDLPLNVRTMLRSRWNEWAEKAIRWETQQRPVSYAQICDDLKAEVITAMKGFKPLTPEQKAAEERELKRLENAA